MMEIPERWRPVPPRSGWRDAVLELEGAYSRRTLDTFLSHFAHFEAWCEGRGLVPLPASVETVAAHVAETYGRLTGNTILTRLWAIRALHDILDLPDPTRGRLVQLAMKRGVRVHGRRVTQARPLRFAELERVLAAAPPTLRGSRDRLMMALAYDTLCRPYELVGLRIEDVRHLENGAARVQVRRAKNDPLGEGGAAYVSPPTVELLKAWLAAAKLTEGAILRQVRASVACPGQLRGQAVGIQLRELATLAGLPAPRAYSGNSPRVGAAQDLAAAGCSLLEIMRAGRWRSAKVVSRYAQAAAVNVWTVVAPTQDPDAPVFRRGPVSRPPNRSGWDGPD